MWWVFVFGQVRCGGWRVWRGGVGSLLGHFICRSSVSGDTKSTSNKSKPNKVLHPPQSTRLSTSQISCSLLLFDMCLRVLGTRLPIFRHMPSWPTQLRNRLNNLFVDQKTKVYLFLKRVLHQLSHFIDSWYILSKK